MASQVGSPGALFPPTDLVAVELKGSRLWQPFSHDLTKTMSQWIEHKFGLQIEPISTTSLMSKGEM